MDVFRGASFWRTSAQSVHSVTLVLTKNNAQKSLWKTQIKKHSGKHKIKSNWLTETEFMAAVCSNSRLGITVELMSITKQTKFFPLFLKVESISTCLLCKISFLFFFRSAKFWVQIQNAVKNVSRNALTTNSTITSVPFKRYAKISGFYNQSESYNGAWSPTASSSHAETPQWFSRANVFFFLIPSFMLGKQNDFGHLENEKMKIGLESYIGKLSFPRPGPKFCISPYVSLSVLRMVSLILPIFKCPISQILSICTYSTPPPRLCEECLESGAN